MATNASVLPRCCTSLLNELRLAASKPEVLATVLRVAASGMSEGEWTAWVERSVQPDISFRK